MSIINEVNVKKKGDFFVVSGGKQYGFRDISVMNKSEAHNIAAARSRVLVKRFMRRNGLIR